MSDKNFPKLYESVKGLTEGLTEGTAKGMSSINPITAIPNAINGIVSSISNAVSKSKDCKARIVESDNTKEVEIVKSNNDVKMEVIKGSFGLAINAADNIDGVVKICNELKEASIGLAQIKADLDAHIANLDFEDRNNDRKFKMWMKQSDDDLIKFELKSDILERKIDSYSQRLDKITDKILSIPTNTLDEEEIKLRTHLMELSRHIHTTINDLLIKLMEM